MCVSEWDRTSPTHPIRSRRDWLPFTPGVGENNTMEIPTLTRTPRFLREELTWYVCKVNALFVFFLSHFAREPLPARSLQSMALRDFRVLPNIIKPTSYHLWSKLPDTFKLAVQKIFIARMSTESINKESYWCLNLTKKHRVLHVSVSW